MTSSAAAKPTGQQYPAVELRHASKLYGNFVALRDVSLSLPAGRGVMLLGPNGAGKSTLLKLLAGLVRPSYGEVSVFGQPPASMRGRIAYMGHSTMLYDELTSVENLAYLLGLQKPELSTAQQKDRVTAALHEVGLEPAIPRRLGEYSQGMRQRAALARVLLTSPEILLLDEPFSNLDISSIELMITRLQRYMSGQTGSATSPTLVLTTHQANLARPLVQSTLTLRDGYLEPSQAPDAGVAGQRPSAESPSV